MKNAIQVELEAIYDNDGALSPEAVVSAARSEQSALHECFQWDDSIAAHQHRLSQARKLIRVAVTIIPSISNGPIRKFVSISSLRGAGSGSYIAAIDLLSDDRKYEQATRDAIRALTRIKLQFEHIADLSPVWDAIAASVFNFERQRAA